MGIFWSLQCLVVMPVRCDKELSLQINVLASTVKLSMADLRGFLKHTLFFSYLFTCLLSNYGSMAVICLGIHAS